MLRRSRFSVRPNVGTAGRTAAGTPQEPPAENRETSGTQKEPVASSSDVTLAENASGTGHGNDQNGEGTNSSASIQRRKRFSIKPKVAPGRPPAISRTPKSPDKAGPATSVDGVCESDLEKPSTSSQPAKTPAPRGLQSPRRRRLSEDANPHEIQPKDAPTSSEKPGPSSVSPSDVSPKQAHQPTGSSKQLETISTSQIKEVHSRAHERIPPSLPDKDTTEISEKAKALVSKKVTSITRSALSLSKLLNDPSDVVRMMKAQKLRELLRQERNKEKKLKRAKARQKEFTLDPTKMTMRDLIHYIPTSNPMTSSLEQEGEENETVIPPSPRREESTERGPTREVSPGKVNSREEEEEQDEGEEDAAEEDQEESLMVPRVKVAEDGSLIIDEESLTVEVQRAKGPNPVSDRDPIFERGSTTTYSSFRKSNYAKPWSIEETDMFYLAISMVGTDFSMICQLFPHRPRSEIKNKFKKEERENSWRIDKAFRERRKLDIEYFSKLLEKILEFQKEKKKLKSLVQKNSKRNSRPKTKRKKAAKKLSDEEEEDDDEVPDLEEGQEKENEDLCNEGETPASEPQKKGKRKKKVEALTEEPNEKKNKTGEVPDDPAAAVPERLTNSEISEMVPNVNTAKETVVKPAKLLRARAPKPLLPLGLKRGKKGKGEEPQSDKGDQTPIAEPHKEQVNKNESNECKTSQEKSAADDALSEGEEETIKHQGPTRYGRIPKQTSVFAYPSKDETHSSEGVENTTATPSASKSKPRCALKRGKQSKPQSDPQPKKAKLVTLRSSKSDFTDEEEEEGQDPGCISSKDMSGMVSSGLHSLSAVISEVDDPMAELDMLASMPDMLGISQDALCPDSSCHQAQHETGTTEASDHQLDLLVDDIEFFTSEQTEVSQDESYNEAAQTLLTIGNISHVSQSTHGELTTQCPTSGTAVDENKSDHLGEKIVSDEQQQSSLPAVCHQTGGEISETVAIVDPENSEMSRSNTPQMKTSEQMCDELKSVEDKESGSPLKSKSLTSNINSESTKRARFSKVKPKPNLGRISRTTTPSLQTEMSKEQKAEESHSLAASEIPLASEEAEPTKKDSDEAMLADGDSFTVVQQTEEKSVNSSGTQVCSVSSSTIKSCSNDASEGRKSPDHKDISLPPQDGPAETDLGNSIKSNLEVTQIVMEPCTLSESFQESSNKYPTPEKDSPVKQKSMGTVPPEKSRLSTVKPLLLQRSRAALNKSQTTKETDALTISKPESQAQTRNDVETSYTSFKPTEDLPPREVTMTHEETHQEKDQNILKVQLSPEPQAELESVVELTGASEESSTTSTHITSSKDLAYKQDSQVSSARPLKRSRLPKVKPRPNLSQTSRTMKTKVQSTEDTAIKSPGPKPESSTKSTDVHLQTICSLTSEYRIADIDSSSRLNPVPTLDPIHVTTASESAIEEKNIHTEVVDQVDIEAGSDQGPRQSQNLIEVAVEQSKKPTSSDSGVNSKFLDKDSAPHNETAESCSNTMTSHDNQAKLDSDPVLHQQDQPEVFTRLEEKSVAYEHNVETATTGQPRKNRLSKIKPRPNIPSTSRLGKFKPQASENQSNSEKPVAELDPNPACHPSSEKQSENNNPALDLTPPLPSESSVRPSSMKETHSDDLAGMGVTALETKKQNSNVNPEQSEKKSTEEQESTSNENLTFPATSFPFSNNEALADQTAKQPQFGQGSNANLGPGLERSSNPAPFITPSEELQASQEENKFPSGHLFKRSRLQKPKPNLSPTSRTARSKADVKSEVQPQDSVQETTMEKKKCTEFTDSNMTSQGGASESMNVEPTVDSAAARLQEGTVLDVGASVQDKTEPLSFVEKFPISDQKVEHSNTGNKAATQVGIKPQSPASEVNQEAVEKVQTNSGEISSSVVKKRTMPERTQRFSKVKPKPNVESTHRVTVRKLQSDDCSGPPEDQISDMSPTAVLEQQLESSKDKISNDNPADPDRLSCEDCNLDMPLTDYSSNAQAVAAQTGIIGVPSTSNPSASPIDSSVQGRALAPSELIDSSKNSGKSPQAHRERLIKPKPNLRCSSRLQQTKPAENPKSTETDSSSTSQAFSASGDQKLVSEFRAETLEPEKDVSTKPSEKDSNESSNDAHSSHCGVTQQPSNEHKTSSTEEIQRASLLSGILPEQVPSDPDEPFFILSLTEIPVPSAGEVEAENLSYLPATGASGLQLSVSEVRLEAEENNPELSVEPTVFKNSTAEPNKANDDDLADKKTRPRRKAKASTSNVSEGNITETRKLPGRKSARKKKGGKSPTSPSKPEPSTSNDIIPTQAISTTDKLTPSVAALIAPSPTSVALTSPERETGFVEEEPTSVSQYFLSDIFTEVEEG